MAIEAVLDYSPTQSLAKHLQKQGRGLRKDDLDEPHILLDLVGNFARHGLPDQEREWSLDGKPKTTRKGEKGQEQIRLCEKCFAAHAPAPACTECGYVYPVQERSIKEIDGELEELDVKGKRRAANQEQAQAQTLADLVELGRKRGYKSPEKWAAHIWTARQAKQNQRMSA
ncbi:MAG: hypothetical protein OIF56_12170 [Cohaesibacter sp.]|nr:hypothetical protein [Cohaesibacter sp.]